jgi:hypothetical protein
MDADTKEFWHERAADRKTVWADLKPYGLQDDHHRAWLLLGMIFSENRSTFLPIMPGSSVVIHCCVGNKDSNPRLVLSRAPRVWPRAPGTIMKGAG